MAAGCHGCPGCTSVAREGVTPTSDQQGMQTGYYVITLNVAGQRPVNCTADDNGNVSELTRAP